jgi:signal transduction histidine kinase
MSNRSDSSRALRWLRLPRRTVRLRLTLLFAVLFMLTGAALLTVTYFLVRRTIDGLHTPDAPVRIEGRLSADGSTYRAEILDFNTVMRTLLVNSGLALAIMTVISVALGWVVAGRILRPLRTITSSVRDISATNLHRRLTLTGPEDELKELGDTFDRLLERLESSFRAQQQFVANASHELRTPLARQRALGQVALADPEASAQTLRAAHERILVAGRQQERMIEALLTLTRSQTGLQVRESVDLARLAQETVTGRVHEAAQRSLSLRRGIEPAVITGHRNLAERLVVNLIDNALRYNIPGGWVQVSTGTARGRAVLEVANTGPDVPAGALDNLFQPFHRLGDTRAATSDSLGLGLSIVRAIADAHDATVDVRPRTDGGLVLTVTFPTASSNITTLTDAQERGPIPHAAL